MRRIFLLVLALVGAFVVGAQDFKYRLDNIESSDGEGFIDFYYGDDGLLLWYKTISVDGWGPLELIDSLSYDQRGNIIRTDVHQKIDGYWRHVYYIEYTYDENDNRISRSNYNSFEGVFELHGVYHYSYNELNQLVYHEVYLDGDLFERANYFYDASGKRTEEVVEMRWGNFWENSSRVTYDYDVHDNCIRKNYFYWMVANWALKEKMEYSYDEVGNCETQIFYSGSYPGSRIIYSYDMETVIEDVVMPHHIEPLYSNFPQYRNRPLSYSYEMADENWTLVYICDYIFEYEEGNLTALPNIMHSFDLKLFPNPANDRVTISLPGLKSVEVINLKGETVKYLDAAAATVTIPVIELAAGVYSVRAFDGRSIQSVKLLVK